MGQREKGGSQGQSLEVTSLTKTVGLSSDQTFKKERNRTAAGQNNNLHRLPERYRAPKTEICGTSAWRKRRKGEDSGSLLHFLRQQLELPHHFVWKLKKAGGTD